MVARHPQRLPGDETFLLHDSYGFPLELTRELAAERGIEVDEVGFQDAMARKRERSRSMTGQRWPDTAALPRSEFAGYGLTELADAEVLAIRRAGELAAHTDEGDEVEVFLDRTPFYGESGGQVGDTGLLEGTGGRMRVEDTQKPVEGVYANIGVVQLGGLAVGDRVLARVDARRRQAIARHHSATHLLHKALREIVGEQTVQRGSWVGPEHTTFDFPLNRALTADELEAIAKRVGQKVRASLPFHESLKPYREAVAGGAMHLFEEKYGDVVRVVCFGDWTCELCCGTHVASTADVGPVVITAESSIGSGLRRIDLVAGEAADDLVRRRLGQLAELARSLGVQPDQAGDRMAQVTSQLRDAERRIRELQDELRQARVGGGDHGPHRVEGVRVPLVTEKVKASGQDDLRAWADRYLEALGGSGVVAVAAGGRYVLKVSKDLSLDANQLKEALGPGGGPSHLVQGRLSNGEDAAFKRLAEMLR